MSNSSQERIRVMLHAGIEPDVETVRDFLKHMGLAHQNTDVLSYCVRSTAQRVEEAARRGPLH